MKMLENRVSAHALSHVVSQDPAHDYLHIQRVVALAKGLCKTESPVNEHVVMVAAWLHDLVNHDKQGPERHLSSRHAAEAATAFLRREALLPEAEIAAVAHAIEAHSYSAGIAPRTLEAKIVQDADRLDAIGAIGISRCLMLGGRMGSALYHPDGCVPQGRNPDDKRYILDHFYTKLFKLPETLHTQSARKEAQRRCAFMTQFVAQLCREIAMVEKREKLS